MVQETLILGAGMTGLAAGMSSGLPVYEASQGPGGICSSYYMRTNSQESLSFSPADSEAYRFEYGGGHWIFGGDPTVLSFLNRMVEVKRYRRRSSVYFPPTEQFIPYPLQNFLRYIDTDIASQALTEMAQAPGHFSSMKEWLKESFGKTLAELFFDPFHQLYTAGLYTEIAPQDAYKSPVNMEHALRGALQETSPVGYNTTFIYPFEGLNSVAGHMANRCQIHYNKKVTKVDLQKKEVIFEDDTHCTYKRLISTLPLNRMMQMTGLSVDARTDPHSSVLVLNIGATRGKKCPDDHWLYIPHSKSNFHRVGFYSNIDRSFLPLSARQQGDKVSIYVERGYKENEKPNEAEIEAYIESVLAELQEWGFITDVDVVHPTWIGVAYTWSWPDSTWKQQAISKLEENDIFQVGRYARWIFQGIADSIRDGFIAGCSFKEFHDT